MLNRIRDVVIVNHRLDPLETELHVAVEVEKLTPETVIKGRLMGPRSVYASTVEVAYPLRELSRGDQIVLRVVIPEPSWWTPETPFLYQGPLELWQNDEMCERVQMSHGIRWLQLTPTGLKLNGRPYTLRGRLIESPHVESQLREWRDKGVNTVLTSPDKLQTEPELWVQADRYGLFVVEQTNIPSHFTRWRNATNDHASVFGWVLHPDLLDPSALGIVDRRADPKSNLFGVSNMGAPLPSGASFVLCTEQVSELQENLDRAKIVVAKQIPNPLPLRPDIIGWIETA